MTGPGYDFRSQESRWRAAWQRQPPARFDLGSPDPARKFYNLVEFPYPSAEGLHVGHVYTYCGADTLGRYLTMNGRQVLQPIGFDSFGIHTENYAIKIGEHPRAVTDRTTANYRRQLERVGANWAWDLAVRTDDPHYYRWTQWIFLRLFKAGLAERREAPVVWCPSCLTVLAFEQVEGNRCERCDSEVTTRVTKQWFLRITAYADQLVDGLDELDWAVLSKRLQRDWIGRSTGCDVSFATQDGTTLTAFTTRVDTLSGVTFVALAPEHPYVETVVRLASNGDDLAAYVAEVGGRIGTDRYGRIGAGGRPGVVTDVTVTHPLTGEQLPIVVADYVLAGYGTGVVMGVPAHDERDLSVATALSLPIRPVTGPSGDGARTRIAAGLRQRGSGGPATRYRLQDWLVSRQRYWGTPIPIVYCASCGTVPVPDGDLPVELPDVADFRPTGTGLSPLAAAPDFIAVPCPSCGEPAQRETDVLDTFVESSWYFLRYPSHDRTDVGWDPGLTEQLLPVDMYAGGQEHATRHHLYARFVTRALHDLGLLPFAEPFTRLRLHGLLVKDGAKMSKSRGNVVNPDRYLDLVGADNLRSYLLFCGPWEDGGDFTDRGLQGLVRFNGRLYDLVVHRTAPTGAGTDLRRVDRAIRKVGGDIERLKFNTALAEIMSLTNWLRDEHERMTAEQWRSACRTLVLLIAPFEPFMAEDLWHRLGGAYSVHQQPWPGYDESALVDDDLVLPVQVNGKVRGTVRVPPSADQAGAVAAAMTVGTVIDALAGATPRRVVFVPGRMLNLVI